MLKGMIKCLKLIARLAIAVIICAIILIAAAMVRAETGSAEELTPETQSEDSSQLPDDPELYAERSRATHVNEANPPPADDFEESNSSLADTQTIEPELLLESTWSTEEDFEISAAVDVRAPTIDEDDLDMLACTIYVEAGGDACSDETRMMVGNVVLNRVAHPDFPGTIEEVLLQPGQYNTFSWTGIVWPARATSDVELHAVDRAYECARRLLEGERVFDESVIWQSNVFQGTEVVSYQDGIYFCR